MRQTVLIVAATFAFALPLNAQADLACIKQEYMTSLQTPQGLNRISSIVQRVSKEIFGGEGMPLRPYSVVEADLQHLQESYKAYPPIEYVGYEKSYLAFDKL